nr:NADH dehydrogenase subunit 3 [Microcosmus sp. z YZ-2024]
MQFIVLFFLLMFLYGLNMGFFYILFFLVFLLWAVGLATWVGDEIVMYNSELEGYECGFENLYTGVQGFSIQFFIVGMSFMLFDLEICLFLPGVVSFFMVTSFQLFMVFFLFILFVFYIYELYIGGLSW